MKITRRQPRAEVPAVAMGDIAFNLLIFFVILARPPEQNWEPAQAARVESSGSSIVSVVLDKEKKLYLNGEPIGVGQLKDAIDKLLTNVPAGRRTVLLKIHKESQAMTFEPILEAVSQAGGEVVHVLEQEQPR
jgi:biopolymer transport protein ExbD